MSDEETESLQNWNDVWESIVDLPQPSVKDSIYFPTNKSKINLTSIYELLQSLDKKVNLLEDKLDQISIELAATIDAKTNIVESYKPYYNKEAYMSSQNFSYLNNDELTFRILIMGDSSNIILYPFGKQKINKEYQTWQYPGYLRDDNDDNIGSVDLTLFVDSGLYALRIDNDFYETDNNEKKSISELPRPFTIIFENKLF